MRNSFSNGSRWMSVARFSTADALIAFSRRITGASLAMSRRCSRSSDISPAWKSSSASARGRFAVVFVDRIHDLLLRREHGADLKSRAVTHRGDGFYIQRIGHRERDGMVLTAHRQAAELPQESRRERFSFGGDKRRTVDGNERHFQLLREG